MLENCRKCGALFNKMRYDICEECQEEEERLLKLTQDFLRDNPDVFKHVVLEALETQGVTLELIGQWVAENRIVFLNPEDEAHKSVCRECGRDVAEGETICRTCKFKALQQGKKADKTPQPAQEGSTKEEPEKKRSHGMYIRSLDS